MKERAKTIEKYDMFMSEEEKVQQEQVKLQVEGLATISKKIVESVVDIDKSDLQILVDAYYQTQRFRIALQNQNRAIDQGKDEDTNKFMARQWILKNVANQELQIKRMIDIYTKNNDVCRWARSTVGIGPIFSAGLYANLEIEGKTKVTQFWSYCGLNDNNSPWLGKDAGKNLLKDVYSVIEDKYNNIILSTNFFNNHDEKTVKKVSKILNNHWKNNCNGSTEEFDSSVPSIIYNDLVPILGSSIADLSMEDENILGMLKYIADPNMITDEVIIMVASTANRNLNAVTRGCVDAKETKKKGYICRTKAGMEAFLAKPPYNLELKKMCYLIGESFCKISGRPDSLYGRLYKERKLYEESNNENLLYKDQAIKKLETAKISKDTDAYKYYSAGKLPPAHINQRAKRYATKMFISHFFECYYQWYYGEKAPLPYVIMHKGHVQYIHPENPYEYFIGELK